MPATTFEDLLRIVRTLLGEGGCAWDRAQTPRSLLPYLIEEAYEVREAVIADDEGALAEELGDLALHVAFQSVLAEGRGAFAPGDVFDHVVAKMVRRHPHVFGSAATDPQVGRASPERAANAPGLPAPTLADWEEMKRRDRRGADGAPYSRARTLEGIPAALPALHRAQRVQDRAAGVGFDWPDVCGAVAKVREELGEVERHLVGARAGAEERQGPIVEAGGPLEEEIGDLLFAVVNVARKSGVSAEEALARAVAKFTGRFARVEDLAAERGLEVRTAGLATLDALWDRVKDLERA
ncbi:MAG: nucleoside triphosphate pyrophosphohydrolase [Gemmatimonadota bacterium]